MKEILRWSPHVVNLQEVDHFEDFFEPRLKKAGFVGVYKRRWACSCYMIGRKLLWLMLDLLLAELERRRTMAARFS